MKPILTAAMIQVLCTTAVQGDDFHVAPSGNDAQLGTAREPFATLARAQRAARQAAGRGPVRVILRGGTYHLPATLVFTPEDSGTAQAPVVYTAASGEEVVLSGGVRLDLQWAPYRDGIRQAKVPAGLTADQLFVNGRRQHLARYPNFDPAVRHFNGYAADAFSPQRAARWADPRGGFIHAMHRAEWGDFHYCITGKGVDNQVTYDGGWQNNRRMGMHGTFRMVENIFEELDARGPRRCGCGRPATGGGPDDRRGARAEHIVLLPATGPRSGARHSRSRPPAAPGRVSRDGRDAGPLRHAAGTDLPPRGPHVHG